MNDGIKKPVGEVAQPVGEVEPPVEEVELPVEEVEQEMPEPEKEMKIAKDVETYYYQRQMDDEAHFLDAGVEKTLAIIKPSLVKYYKRIRVTLRENGFRIQQQRKAVLTPEQACEFYKEHYHKLYFPKLVSDLCSGPIIAMCLVKSNAIHDWKQLMGPADVRQANKYFPRSLRAKYGNVAFPFRNGFHGSDAILKSEREIHFFFPEVVFDPQISDGDLYLRNYVIPTLSQGLYHLCQAKPVEPVIWLADWLLMNNPFKARMAERFATTAT